jgi:hypothetical protein
MEIIGLRALWKGLRGRSLTFSVVFAMAVLGSSFAGLLRAPLRTIGIWAPLVFLLPILATGLLARQERKLHLRDEFRCTLSYSLIFGSIALAILLWRYQSWLEAGYADSLQQGPLYEKRVPADTPRGPRGKH